MPVGDGFLAMVAVGIHHHLAAVVGATPDVAFNSAFVLVEVTPNQGVVTAVDGVLKKLVCQYGLCGLILGNDHQTSGVLIDTVYQIAEFVLHRLFGLLKMPSQSVKQGAFEVAMAGVYHQSSLFVDHDDVVVFVNDIQRNLLRCDVDFPRGIAEHDGDDVVRLHLIVLLHRFVVDKDVACFGSVLNAVTRDVLNMVGQEGVDTFLGLAFVDHDTDMLI